MTTAGAGGNRPSVPARVRSLSETACSTETSDGANVQQYADTGHATQDWIVLDDGDGTFALENANSGKVVDVYESSTADGANVVQWSWNGGPQQRWTLEKV